MNFRLLPERGAGTSLPRPLLVLAPLPQVGKMNGNKLDDGCAFFLVKSDVRKRSADLAGAIAKVPGFREVWFTEGEYSFLAKFSAPEESLPGLESRIRRQPGILGVSCLPAPLVVKA